MEAHRVHPIPSFFFFKISQNNWLKLVLSTFQRSECCFINKHVDFYHQLFLVFFPSSNDRSVCIMHVSWRLVFCQLCKPHVHMFYFNTQLRMRNHECRTPVRSLFTSASSTSHQQIICWKIIYLNKIQLTKLI